MDRDNIRLRRILYAGLVVLSLVFLSFYGGNLPYTLFYLLLVNTVVSVAYIAYVYYSLKINQSINEHGVHKGKYVNYGFKVINDGFLACTSVKFNFIDELSTITGKGQLQYLGLESKECVDRQLELLCDYSGTYYAGVESIEIMDYFGIIRIKFPMPQKMKVVVKPRILKISNLNFMKENEDYINSSQFRQDDFTTDNEVRVFQNGDSTRLIHWKNSAKRQELMVRNNAAEESVEYVVIMDGAVMGEDYIDRIIEADKIRETVVAVINYLYTSGCYVNCGLGNSRIKSVNSKSDFKSIYEEISGYTFQVRAQGTDEIYNTVRRVDMECSEQTAVIVVSAYEKPQSVSSFNRNVFWVCVNSFDKVEDFFDLKE